MRLIDKNGFKPSMLTGKDSGKTGVRFKIELQYAKVRWKAA